MKFSITEEHHLYVFQIEYSLLACYSRKKVFREIEKNINEIVPILSTWLEEKNYGNHGAYYWPDNN